jgi:xanthine dehydrogenase accessory factor
VTIDVLELARERRRRREPFVLATVVWRRAPSSGKQGSKALIGPDGSVSGWIGGACAEPAVAREAVRALEDGEPRLMFLGPSEELANREREEGVLSVPIACQSEGAMEVYLEPELPKPQLVAIGRSPAVDALAAIARTLGWRPVVVDQGGLADDHPDAELVVGELDLDAAGVDPSTCVVVATQGHYDEPALERALASRPAYVGLVASKRRAEAVLGYLRDRGVAEEELRRVHAPAGLDLGPVAPEEIAVAIAADLVHRRAAGELRARVAPAPAAQAVDPVCGMAVDPASSPHRAEHHGVTYHFCSVGCQDAFEADPDRHLAAARGA